jgi:hypothetical protein
LLAATVSGPALHAKDKHRNAGSAKSQDEIVVQAHLTLADGPITRFVATRHFDRTYIYAERQAGQPITLIDMTNPSHPQVLSDAALPASQGNLLSVAGTAALAGDTPIASAPTSQTIRLMDFSDPAKPKVTREFVGVTALENISGGSVILLANADGVWVLSQHFAQDPAEEERYARKVVYGESMY